MAVLKIYLKTHVKSEDGFNKSLEFCRGRLENYFNRCIARTDGRPFNQAQVMVNAPMQMIDDNDLLVYILASPNYTKIPEKFHSPTVGGKTQWYPGGVLSEIFANRAWEEGNSWLFGSSPTKQGIALANLAFHELAHNKWHGFPQAEKVKYKVAGKSDDIHLIGGVFDGGLYEGVLGKLDLTPENEQLMAAMLPYPVKQCKLNL